MFANSSKHVKILLNYFMVYRKYGTRLVDDRQPTYSPATYNSRIFDVLNIFYKMYTAAAVFKKIIIIIKQ